MTCSALQRRVPQKLVLDLWDMSNDFHIFFHNLTQNLTTVKNEWSMRALFSATLCSPTFCKSPLLYLLLSECLKQDHVPCSGRKDIKDQGQTAWLCCQSQAVPAVPHSFLNHSWTLLYLFWGHCLMSVTSDLLGTQPTSWPCSLGTELTARLASGLPCVVSAQTPSSRPRCPVLSGLKDYGMAHHYSSLG